MQGGKSDSNVQVKMHIYSLIASGATINNHGRINRRVSASTIDVRSGGDAGSDNSVDKSVLLAHGTLAIFVNQNSICMYLNRQIIDLLARLAD